MHATTPSPLLPSVQIGPGLQLEPCGAFELHTAETTISLSVLGPAIGSPKKVLQAQAKALERVDPAYKRLAEGPFPCGPWLGWFLEERLELEGERVEQLSVALEVNGLMVVASATAADASLSRRRDLLAEICAGLS